MATQTALVALGASRDEVLERALASLVRRLRRL